MKSYYSQTIGEEIANAVSHGTGALLALVGSAVLIPYAAHKSTTLATVSVSVFCLSMLILYLFSTLYHSLPNNKAKSVFRIFDHCSIFILIFGTYTPVSLCILKGVVGYSLLIFNLTLGTIGIVLNSINLNKWNKISQIMYALMGWSVAAVAPLVIKIIGLRDLILLFTGGVFYTVGIIFYRAKKPRYMHFIWHLFVLVGSLLHYFFIMFHCV
ncbi:MAG: hemolysin III family protein [bacterium]|nr:hemolysin III family protein [bacterium]